MSDDCQTRRRILAAALKRFADCGYAGASVQDIVDAARVTKPTLYYYFSSKAKLYEALIDRAYDERLRLMREAAGTADSLAEQLTEILTALFEFLNHNRALMRLAFATAFAAPGEVPARLDCLTKGWRNFEFLRTLIQRARARGRLNRLFSSRQLTLGIYGMMNLKIMEGLVTPSLKLTRRDAEHIVQLYLQGARRKP